MIPFDKMLVNPKSFRAFGPTSVLLSANQETVFRKEIRGASFSNASFRVAGYIPQFDGLRGISILAVFAAHSEFLRALPHANLAEYGRVGVDLFFVLSGFLITGILIDSRDFPHYFRNFYARRTLRIWPLYYVVLTLTLIGTTLLGNSFGPQKWQVWPYFYLYLQNLFQDLTIPYGLGLTWSLAIEEQFYLAWPLVIFVLRKKALAITLVCFSLLSLVLRITAYEHGASLKFIHNFTLCKLDAIAFGSLAALWLRSEGCTRLLWRRRAVQSMAVGVIGVIAARIFFHDQSTVVSYTFIAIGFTGVLGIALISDPDRSLLGKVLSSRWLRYTGRISYGLYLVHLPIFLAITEFARARPPVLGSPTLSNIVGAVAQVSAAFLIASISWRFLETPLLRLKSHFAVSHIQDGRPHPNWS